MTLSDSIRINLPYLRRYSRALAGSQKAGDAYVKATLETIISAPSEFNDQPNVRTSLYRVFQQIWNSAHIDVPLRTSFFDDLENASRVRLASITPLSRQVLLLSALEGFSPAEAANITGCSPENVSELLNDAIGDIDNEASTSVLIIEDEPLISMELEQIVRGAGHDIAGTAATHKDALAAVKKQLPGLVLADIQLADGSSGIDAVRDILTQIDVPVIFVTAFPERLLTGEAIEPTFLITKPFHTNAVRAAISQALFFEMKAMAA